MSETLGGRPGRLLLVDDDADFRAVYKALLEADGYEVGEAADRAAARAALAGLSPDVVLLDLMLPPDGTVEGGLALLAELLATRPTTKVVVVSGAGDLTSMVEAVRRGATDFLTKPAEPEVVAVVVGRALARRRLEAELEGLRESLSRSRPEGSMLGRSPAFLEAVRLAERVAAADLPVLVTGETGTGKELVARLVHERSPRGRGPFVALSCGALPSTLVESTLFGHRRGAFTGADRDRPGAFVEASGGTLFLDEVGELAPSAQAALLRALESGEVTAVGADRPARVDVRLVSATNRDLAAAVAAGELRQDLYYRIRGVEVRLPPLRERGADLELLAEHFLAQAAALAPDGRARLLGPTAREAVLAHDWPGNLRELRHEMQRATVLAGERAEIEARDLSVGSPPGLAAPGTTTLADRLAAFERREIEAALAACHGNRTHAAQRLGLSRQGLLNKIERYGL